MTLILGLDTGGTYTDAALLDSAQKKVLASAKALTTRHDLSIGVGNAIQQTLDSWKGDKNQISLVSLSTTLATNAVVESVGGVACLVLIGFDENILSRASLNQALGQEPCLHIAGGHKADGKPQAPLDEKALLEKLSAIKGQISSVAIASHFATRNPEHEKMAKQLIKEHTDLPVTCSHELSSALGGPRRALTALLNARLIALLDRLIIATQSQMSGLGLDCPLMVVKGDGSLLHADFARNRPVETILSGPAASLAGASFLANLDEALIADIGGTTTDIARLQGGGPLLSHEGAFVGGWRTMVEAARIRTCGLGGDSEAKIDNRSMTKKIILGPRRAVPLSLLSMEHPELIAKMQDQLKQPIAQNSDGHFIIPMMADEPPDWLSRSEMALARKALDHKVIALDELASTQVALGAVNRLIRRGLLMMSAFTPTDASHVLGHFDRFNGPAARLGALLLARQKTASGTQLAPTAEQVSQMTLDALTLHSSVFILDTAFSEQGEAEGLISASPFLTASMDKTAEHPRKTASVSLKLDIPLIALGASAATYYPAVARYLDAELVIPPFSEVAGAVGAAAGGVRQRVVVLITQPSEGVFRLHLPEGLKDFPVLDQALGHGVEVASQLAENRAKAAGAKQVSLSLEEKIEEVPLGPDKTLFLQAIITANASGRPS